MEVRLNTAYNSFCARPRLFAGGRILRSQRNFLRKLPAFAVAKGGENL